MSTRQRLARSAVTVAFALAGSAATLPLEGQTSRPQAQAPPRVLRPVVASKPFTLIFEVHTASGRLGGATDDQIMIIFSDTSADSLVAPNRFFADANAEFSFSGMDARPQRPFTFERGVDNIDFLRSRYIRVVNHGSDAWAGEFLSLSVRSSTNTKGLDLVLVKQSLYPRLGRSMNGGIERFNPRDWSQRVYWEGDLQRLRRDRKAAS